MTTEIAKESGGCNGAAADRHYRFDAGIGMNFGLAKNGQGPRVGSFSHCRQRQREMKPATMILDPADCERMPPGGGKATCLGPSGHCSRPLFLTEIISSMVKAARSAALAERRVSTFVGHSVSREPGFRFLEPSGMFKQIKQAACFLSIGAFGIVGCSQGNAVNTAAPAQRGSALESWRSSNARRGRAGGARGPEGLEASRRLGRDGRHNQAFL
jgi:hypothetical protein